MMFLFLPLMAAVHEAGLPALGSLLRRAPAVPGALPLVLLPAEHRRDPVPLGRGPRGPGRLPLGLITGVAFIYLPVYLFRAMRVVYGQGFFATLFKYVLLGLAYLLALLATFLGLVAYTAFTL
jgi:hypothetical protein